MKSGLITRLFLTLLLLTATACSSLLYYPAKGTYLEPSKIHLKYENHFIDLENGIKIHTWYFSAVGKSKGTLLFFHGNGENLTSHYLALNWLPREGYDYIIFDYPGYNLSSGEPTPQNTVEAGLAVAKWLVQNKKPSKLFIFAQSLGGAVALKTVELLKKDITIDGIVIEGSFHSYQRTGQKVLAKNWFTWPIQWMSYLVLSDKWTNRNLQEISPIPILSYHAPEDSVVPYELGKELFTKLPEPKKFIEVPEGNHCNTFFVANGKYRKSLLDFLSQHSN